MTITFTEFVGKAPRLEAIQVTAENIEELAVWMGADSYSVDKILVGGERKVSFNKIIKYSEEYRPDRANPIVRTRIGDWIVKVPEMVMAENARLYDTHEAFYSYTQEDIDRFVEQKQLMKEVDLNKE